MHRVNAEMKSCIEECLLSKVPVNGDGRKRPAQIRAMRLVAPKMSEMTPRSMSLAGIPQMPPHL